MLRPVLAGTACLLVVTVSSASATFTKPRAATASFTTTTLAVPTSVAGSRCALSTQLTVTWVHSTSAFATGQVVAYSASPTFATTAGSTTLANNTTQTTTFTVVPGVYYVRVTATYLAWTTTSGIATVSVPC